MGEAWFRPYFPAYCTACIGLNQVGDGGFATDCCCPKECGSKCVGNGGAMVCGGSCEMESDPCGGSGEGGSGGGPGGSIPWPPNGGCPGCGGGYSTGTWGPGSDGGSGGVGGRFPGGGWSRYGGGWSFEHLMMGANLQCGFGPDFREMVKSHRVGDSEDLVMHCCEECLICKPEECCKMASALENAYDLFGSTTVQGIFALGLYTSIVSIALLIIGGGMIAALIAALVGIIAVGALLLYDYYSNTGDINNDVSDNCSSCMWSCFSRHGASPYDEYFYIMLAQVISGAVGLVPGEKLWQIGISGGTGIIIDIGAIYLPNPWRDLKKPWEHHEAPLRILAYGY